jgi:hypothetical protein
MKINDLRPKQIDWQNVNHVLDLMNWVTWKYKRVYGDIQKRVPCPTCGDIIPLYTDVFPDGSHRTSLSIHKEGHILEIKAERAI